MSYASSKQERLKRKHRSTQRPVREGLYGLIHNHPNSEILSGESTHTLGHINREDATPELTTDTECKGKSLSHVRLFVTLWTIQGSRPEYWSG